jgi:type 1 fimbria pilin
MKAQFNNKTLLAIAIAALLPAGTALAAGTSGGTVNFSGKVVTSACAISAGSANIDVDMGEVRTATLKTAALPARQKRLPSPWKIAKSPILSLYG